MIMAMIALAVRHHPMPHVMIFLIGPGGEGKTLFTMKLLKAVFGTGHASPSSKMLQVEEEFRQQGHLIVQADWLAFDEIKPNSIIEDEIFKLLVCGGLLDLRRNHEAETGYAS